MKTSKFLLTLAMFATSATAFMTSRSSALRVAQRAPRAATRRMSMDADFDGFSHKVAFCFPGQGAQYVGMCKDVVETVPKAAELFEKASLILGYDLLDCCINGPA